MTSSKTDNSDPSSENNNEKPNNIPRISSAPNEKQKLWTSEISPIVKKNSTFGTRESNFLKKKSVFQENRNLMSQGRKRKERVTLGSRHFSEIKLLNGMRDKEIHSFDFDKVLLKASLTKTEKDLWGNSTIKKAAYLNYLKNCKEFNENDFLENLKGHIEIRLKEKNENMQFQNPEKKSSGLGQNLCLEEASSRELNRRISKRSPELISQSKISNQMKSSVELYGKNVLELYKKELDRKDKEIDAFLETVRLRRRDIDLNKFFDQTKKGLYLCDLRDDEELPKKFKKLFGYSGAQHRSHRVLYKDPRQVRELKSKQKNFFAKVDQQAEAILFERIKKNEAIKRNCIETTKAKLKMIRDLKKYSLAPSNF